MSWSARTASLSSSSAGMFRVRASAKTFWHSREMSARLCSTATMGLLAKGQHVSTAALAGANDAQGVERFVVGAFDVAEGACPRSVSVTQRDARG